MQSLSKPNPLNLLNSAGIKLFIPAEQSVVTLLLEGLSNRAIAQKLILSTRTIESHISHALAKTGCSSRLELTLWVIANDQARVPIPVVKVP